MTTTRTPCRCPRCGWLGTLHDTHEYRPTDADFNELQAVNVCPRCAPEIEVQMLRQKGLDALRHEYALLLKPGYTGKGGERDERRDQIERFFEHIDQPLRSTSGPMLAMEFKIIEPGEKTPHR
jgi:hypothetical protein